MEEEAEEEEEEEPMISLLLNIHILLHSAANRPQSSADKSDEFR